MSWRRTRRPTPAPACWRRPTTCASPARARAQRPCILLYMCARERAWSCYGCATVRWTTRAAWLSDGARAGREHTSGKRLAASRPTMSADGHDLETATSGARGSNLMTSGRSKVIGVARAGMALAPGTGRGESRCQSSSSSWRRSGCKRGAATSSRQIRLHGRRRRARAR